MRKMKAIVSLTFDDGWKSTIENAVPVIDQAGLKGTFYVITSPPEKGFNKEQYATPEQIKSLYLSGHEIGSHTISHPHLPRLSGADAKKEIVESAEHLKRTGIPVDTFAYPYGQYDASIAKIVCEAGYQGARSICLGYNDQDTDRFRLKCQGVVMPVPFALVKHWINQAKTHDKWLILVFHQIEPTMMSLVKQRAIYGATVSTLRRIVEYLEKQGIEVVTVREGVESLFPNCPYRKSNPLWDCLEHPFLGH
jgi:peptidoglycan/xylan/chitin deacetylase (PgdA/CDA1 family)